MKTMNKRDRARYRVRLFGITFPSKMSAGLGLGCLLLPFLIVGVAAFGLALETLVVYVLYNLLATNLLHTPVFPSIWMALLVTAALNLIGSFLSSIFGG